MWKAGEHRGKNQDPRAQDARQDQEPRIKDHSCVKGRTQIATDEMKTTTDEEVEDLDSRLYAQGSSVAICVPLSTQPVLS